MYFAAQCLSAMKTDYEKQQCYTWRAALDEANFFCSVFSFHWNMKALYKFHYEKARGTAGTGLKENRELEYTNVKFDCQVNLPNTFLKFLRLFIFSRRSVRRFKDKSTVFCPHYVYKKRHLAVYQ